MLLVSCHGILRALPCVDPLAVCLHIRALSKQLEEMHTGRQELVTKYEEQLQHVRDEVGSAGYQVV